jgi:hypothetical protein
MINTINEDQVLKIIEEGAVSVTDAAARIPPERGKCRRAETLTRWITEGKGGVRLEGFYGADKTWMTSLPALARFFAALTTARLSRRQESPPQPQTASRRAQAAGEELDRLRRSRGKKG